jgi:hypothetical protein
MNYVANVPQFSLYWLQQRNIRKKVSKPDLIIDKIKEEPATVAAVSTGNPGKI